MLNNFAHFLRSLQLWSYITFKKQPEESNYSLSSESLSVRRRAGHSMVDICKSMAAFLLVIVDDRCNNLKLMSMLIAVPVRLI